MAALTQNANIPKLAGDNLVIAIPLKNEAKVYAGGLIAINTGTGEAEAASDSASLVVVGRCKGYVDNTGDGKNVEVERGIFRYANSGDNALTRANIGEAAYVEDDNTVGSSAGANSVVAGLVHDVDDTYVWVDVRPGAVALAREIVNVKAIGDRVTTLEGA